MGGIDPRPIEVLTLADAAGVLALSQEAGWNQTADDWRLFVESGTVFGTRARSGEVVATAAILPYGRAVWISLVLVTRAWRRRGLASALMGRCLTQADRAGWQAWLDATPAGAEVYAQLGFRTIDEMIRLRRPVSPRRGAAPKGGNVADLLSLDRDVLGLDRHPLIESLASRAGSAVFGSAEACCLVRNGLRARQIGPAYGRSPDAVADLVAQIARAEPGELVIDLYAHQTCLGERLLASGFAVERPFLRMTRGSDTPRPASSSAFAGAGPEYG